MSLALTPVGLTHMLGRTMDWRDINRIQGNQNPPLRKMPRKGTVLSEGTFFQIARRGVNSKIETILATMGYKNSIALSTDFNHWIIRINHKVTTS